MSQEQVESVSWFPQHDNALSHKVIIVHSFRHKNTWLLNHPPYSLDLTQTDYFLFPKLKGQRFDSILEVQEAATKHLNAILKEDFHRGIQQLYKHQHYKRATSK